MQTLSFEQMQPARVEESAHDTDSYDPWQSARVFLYHDAIAPDGLLQQGLVNETWLQLGRRLDVEEALDATFYHELTPAAQAEIQHKVAGEVALFDFAMLQRLRSGLIGQLATNGRLIIRAEESGLMPSEHLGGWQHKLPELVDGIAQIGLGKQIGIRLERSRLTEGTAAETSVVDITAVHY